MSFSKPKHLNNHKISTKNMIKPILTIFSTVLLISCGGEDPVTDFKTVSPDPDIGKVQEDLAVAKQVWQDSGLVDYTFDYYVISNQGCLPEGVASDPLPARSVTVEDNEIVYVEIIETGDPIDLSSTRIIGTIDDIFDYLEQKLSEKPSVISQSYSKQEELPLFDEDFGYPRSFYVRIDHSEGCDSLTLYLSNLR